MKSPVSIFLLLLILSIIVPSTISFVEKIGDKKAMAEIEASAQQSYYVTVDAGFSNGAQGKTSIELSDGISHFVLSSGDRLYVRAVISGTAPEKILAGYLTMSDVEKGAPKATFNGALLPYEWNESQNRYVNTKHDFNNVDDPLSECENVYAMFVGKDADNFRIGDDDKRGFYSVSIASDVKTLRMRCLEVLGTYDNSTRFIALNSDNPSVCAPIFNYSISGGLTPNATYNVLYVSSATGTGEFPTYSVGTVTADSEGKVGFACYNCSGSEDYVQEIRFVNKNNESDVKHVTLGMKAVTSKVYNITSAATSESRVMAMANISSN